MSYVPGELSSESLEALKRSLQDELLKISEAIRIGQFERINLESLAVEPSKPRLGDVVNADGTNWNPGEGAGIYRYTTSYVRVG
jgi:hypothetical protein